MKKAVIGVILYLLIVHILIPGIFYLYEGQVIPLYSEIIDYPSFIKGALIISTSFVFSILILCFLPKGGTVKAKIDSTSVTSLFYFSVLFKLMFFYIYGGFGGLIDGEANGKLSSYISIFLNPYILLLVIFFGQKKKSSLIKPVLFYIISVTLSGSRSGILSVFFVFFIGYAFDSFIFYKSRIIKFLKYALIISPLLYIFATQVRHGSEIDYSFLKYAIAGRLSTMETAMLPIYFKDNNLEMGLFYDKYSIIHQFKLVLDSFIPGQIFEFDIMPNNYYRAIFSNASISYVQENYMSINMTLPVYLYVKYGYFAVFLTAVYIVGFYLLLRFFRNSPLLVIALLSVLYGLIYFFDWLMIFGELYSALLTVLTIKAYLFCRRLLIPYFKIKEYTVNN